MKRVFMIMVVLFSLTSCELMNKETVETTILSKERVYHGGGSYYLIFTNDETFKLTDGFIAGRFNSSDIYGRIKTGKKYRLKVAGVRIGYFSQYRNIHDIELLE